MLSPAWAKVVHGDELRRLARGHREGRDAALECGHALLQHGVVGFMMRV